MVAPTVKLKDAFVSFPRYISSLTHALTEDAVAHVRISKRHIARHFKIKFRQVPSDKHQEFGYLVGKHSKIRKPRKDEDIGKNARIGLLTLIEYRKS